MTPPLATVPLYTHAVFGLGRFYQQDSTPHKVGECTNMGLQFRSCEAYGPHAETIPDITHGLGRPNKAFRTAK